MTITKQKGGIAESAVMAECLRRGYQVAIPFGEDWRYDLIVLRNGVLERVQVKYVKSDGNAIIARTRSCNNWSIHKYTKSEIDWIAIYDDTTKSCYFVPSILLGDGKSQLNFRISLAKNKQTKRVTYVWQLPEF